VSKPSLPQENTITDITLFILRFPQAASADVLSAQTISPSEDGSLSKAQQVNTSVLRYWDGRAAMRLQARADRGASGATSESPFCFVVPTAENSCLRSKGLFMAGLSERALKSQQPQGTSKLTTSFRIPSPFSVISSD
jgi:hypothetical protein